MARTGDTSSRTSDAPRSSGARDAAGTRDAAGGIQSLDGALHLLRVLAQQSGATALGELARLSGMPSPKAHRYLASFLHAGLVRKDGAGRYDLGRGAMEVGLAALARRETVNAAADALPDLVAETGHTGLISVWGDRGPTVVRWQRAAAPIVTSLGLGTTFPLLSSATGRAFLAHMPEAMIASLRDAELRRARARPDLIEDITGGAEGTPTAAVRSLVENVRERGYATVDGRFIPGLVALAAPVLDWQGEAELAVTLIGTDPDMTRPGSPTIASLRAFCTAHSVSPSKLQER